MAVTPREPSQATAASTARRRNGSGTASLVIGVLALVLAVLIIFSPLAGILGIVAAVLGGIGLARANRGEADNRSHAVAGLATGLAAFVIAGLIAVRIGTFIYGHQDDFGSFWRCITSAPTKAQQNDCGKQLARRLER